MIWYKNIPLIEELNNLGKGTLGDHLGMQFIEIGNDFLKATMPVNEKTKQPYGLLHGGASCALAETLGSVASALVINTEKFFCVGLEINANHLRSATHGLVTGLCTPIHIGARTHVWDIKIFNEAQKLVCISRLTTAILPIKTNE
jgi:1,4-dihydroxy-2-naphthoyl-CoA hydrolase